MPFPQRAPAPATVALCLAVALLVAEPVLAQDQAPYLGQIVSPTDFGGIGLMQMRTARMGPDSLMNVGYSEVYPYKKSFLNVHILPWAEATFRYTEVQNRLYSNIPTFSGSQTYKDRSADVKFRLLREGDRVPELAVGFQDLLGTGLFAGEYLVASKRYYDFDFSLGLGWGYVGSRGTLPNPLRNVFSTFTPSTGQGGQLNVTQFFSGKTMGAFGGLEYHTPLTGLTLKVEYDAHDYAREQQGNALPMASPINFGLNFQPYSWIDLSIGRERGNTYMTRISLRANLNDGGGVPKFDPPPPPVEPRKSVAELAQGGPAVPAPAAPAPAPALRPAPAPAPLSLPTAAPAPPATGRNDGAAGIFAALAANRLDVDDLAIEDNDMVIHVFAAGPGAGLAAAARAALAAAPADLAAVTVYAPGLGAARAVRQIPTSGGDADALYRHLDSLGLPVADVELRGDSALVRIAVGSMAGDRTWIAAVRIAAGDLGAPEVELRLEAGVAARPAAFAYPVPFADQPTATAGADFRLPPVVTYSRSEKDVIRRRSAAALQAQGFILESLDFDGRAALAEVTMSRFPQVARNYGYAARVLANNLPAPIEEITIAALSGGMQVSRITFRRTDIERAATAEGAPEEVFVGAAIAEGEPLWPGWSDRVPGHYPHFHWGLTPQTRQHIGGPDQFLLYQFWLVLDAGVDVGRGLSLQARLGKNIYNNFDKINLKSDSRLPHVRSDIKEYLQHGPDNLGRLEADFYLKLAPDLYGRVSAGIFEEMYGGVSTEVLYRPFNSRLALGLELDRVQQRDFDQRLTFLPYKATTGHFSLYYELPYLNMLAAAHFGRYLAGDHGATYELSRRFDSGLRMGMWATFTNVSPALFGEGSFDKGFFIVIPFDMLLTQSTPTQGVFAFRPLFRDGGQRLIVADRLYDVTGNGNLDAVTKDWPQLFR